ncbi:MAG: hypothetical protein ABIN48_05725 [Ginsengibacter sp.]
MKQTLLFSAAIIFSTALFAQTTVNNNSNAKSKTTVQSTREGSGVSSSGSASSTTKIESNDVSKIEKRSKSEIKKGKKAAAHKKEQAKNELKSTGEELNEMSSADAKISASGQSNSSVNFSDNDNNANQSNSLKSNVLISADNQGSTEGKTLIKTKVSEVTEGTANAGTEVRNRTSKKIEKMNKRKSVSVNAGANTSNNIEVKPATIKTGTIINGNTGIKIK